MELTDKVAINNLCSWALYFKRENGVGDIRIPANAKNFSQLDVAEVQMQIQRGNPLFVGDGRSNQGDHARLFMMRSASAMAEANNTIDESIALIVAANNVIQDPDVVGTMWKTVSMRIRGAKTELEEAGLETEYMAETTASLRKKILGLTNVDGSGGFDIMLDEETFKSTYDIMLGISEVWEDMSDIDQAALLELLAGKRQGNALAAAITNMGDAVKVMDTSLNAEGSAVREHEKWMDSIQAKQQQFQAQYEVFANTILSSDLIKGVFDAGTGLLGWLTTLVDTVGALPAVFATVMPFLDKLNLFRTTDQKNWGGSGTGIAFAWNAQKLELDNDIILNLLGMRGSTTLVQMVAEQSFFQAFIAQTGD